MRLIWMLWLRYLRHIDGIVDREECIFGSASRMTLTAMGTLIAGSWKDAASVAHFVVLILLFLFIVLIF